jgi:hypothetical protein
MVPIWAWVQTRSRETREVRRKESEERLKERLKNYQPTETKTWRDVNLPAVTGLLAFMSILKVGENFFLAAGGAAVLGFVVYGFEKVGSND